MISAEHGTCGVPSVLRASEWATNRAHTLAAKTIESNLVPRPGAILVWGVAVHQARYDGVHPLGSQPGNYSNKWPSLYLLTAASMAFVNVAGLSCAAPWLGHYAVIDD